MVLTADQVKNLKRQLSEQIKDLPDQQRQAAQMQIDSMSDEALESMIKQQQAMNSEEGVSQKGVLRRIVDGEISSKKIDENKDCLAVLDIRPISDGHIIIIPKKPVIDAKSIPGSCFSIAKKLANRVMKILKSKGAEIQTEFKVQFGEMVLNVIPIYDKSLSINSPRKEANEKELDSLYEKIRIVKKKKVEKIKVKTNKEEKVLKLKRRIA